MKKVAFLLIALLLVACNATTDPTAAPTGEPAAAVPASDNTTETAEEQPAAAADTAVASDPVNKDFTIAATPEEAGRVRTRDWVKGATDPKVTIIEYGDFQ